MKDIDPEECMNMVKAFVNAANTYRDGTYGAYRRYRSTVQLPVYLELPRYRSHWAQFTGAHAKETSARARSSSVVHRRATTREADAAQTCAITG